MIVNVRYGNGDVDEAVVAVEYCSGMVSEGK